MGHLPGRHRHPGRRAAEIANEATGSHEIAKRTFYASGVLEFPGACAVRCQFLAVTAAARAALGLEKTPDRGGPDERLAPEARSGDARSTASPTRLWLHGRRRWLTKNMTTEEREALADAMERSSAHLEPEDPATVDHWQRDPVDGPTGPGRDLSWGHERSPEQSISLADQMNGQRCEAGPFCPVAECVYPTASRPIRVATSPWTASSRPDVEGTDRPLRTRNARGGRSGRCSPPSGSSPLGGEASGQGAYQRGQ